MDSRNITNRFILLLENELKDIYSKPDGDFEYDLLHRDLQVIEQNHGIVAHLNEDYEDEVFLIQLLRKCSYYSRGNNVGD